MTAQRTLTLHHSGASVNVCIRCVTQTTLIRQRTYYISYCWSWNKVCWISLTGFIGASLFKIRNPFVAYAWCSCRAPSHQAHRCRAMHYALRETDSTRHCYRQKKTKNFFTLTAKRQRRWYASPFLGGCCFLVCLSSVFFLPLFLI